MTTTVLPETASPPSSVDRYPWLPLASGVLTMVAGVVALVYPGPTLLVVGVLIGIYLVLWGAAATIRGIGGGDTVPVAPRVVLMVVGLIAVLAGLYLVVRPSESVLSVARAIGFWWVLTGILELAQGIVLAEGRAWNLLLGMLGVAAGTVILAQPEIGLTTLVWVSGIGLIACGAVASIAAWQFWLLHKRGVL